MKTKQNRFSNYFWSGSNNAGEIRALTKHGKNVGVAVDILIRDDLRALPAIKEMRGTGIPIFVDSGAFGEVDIIGGRVKVKKPITSADWVERLDVYETIAAELGAFSLCVAPDRVGDQAVTLQRLKAHRDQIRRIVDVHGGRLIIPCQNGRLTLAAFWRKAVKILGVKNRELLIPGMPMKKGATSSVDVVDFLETTGEQVIHLLGLGELNNLHDPLCSMIAEACPTVQIWCDSVRLRAITGRTNGPKSGRRALTIVRDRICARIGVHPKQRLPIPQVEAIKFEAVDTYLSAVAS
jgi:hypothetical protein